MILRHDLSLEEGIAGLRDEALALWGFRMGSRGTHTSRTIMLDDLAQLLAAVPSDARRGDYSQAVVADNCLGKRTAATRKASFQRLAELYGLDSRLILFRALRCFWDRDENARPALALLLALARDPLLRASARAVLSTPPGHEFNRQPMKDALAAATKGRLSAATLEAVVRNAASSWTQSGHLGGRSRKTRLRISPTPAATAYALLMVSAVGSGGRAFYDTPWVVVLDIGINEFLELILKARMLGLLEFKHAAKTMDLSFPQLVTRKERDMLRESR